MTTPEESRTPVATRVMSVSMVVADQDAALAFYTDVLGFTVRLDVEPFPGQRMVEVVPPGSDVGIVLLPPDSQIPNAVRVGTHDAQDAYDRVRAAGATMHNDEVLRLQYMPPMFSCSDPDGNGLVFLEE